MIKKGLLFVCLLLVLPMSYGAVISGSVYDFELDLINNSIVSVNTSPNQIFVARNGSYSFNLPAGEYVLIAKNKNLDLFVEESIVVDSDNSFVLDLIMLPSFNDFDDFVNETEQLEFDNAFADEIESSNYKYFMFSSIILFVMFVLVILYFERRFKKYKELPKDSMPPVEVLDQDAKRILDFIKKNNNRVTQRDLRKSFPMSEAKISLIVADLEAKGLISKIKKGRGNIIVLK